MQQEPSLADTAASLGKNAPGGVNARLARALRPVNDALDRALKYPYLYIVLMLPLIQPMIVELFCQVHSDYTLLTAMRLAGQISLYLALAAYAVRWLGGRIKRFNPIIALVIALNVWLVIITKIRGGNYYYQNELHPALALMLLLDMGLQREKKSALNALAVTLEFYVYLNLLSLLLQPNGIYVEAETGVRYWILGSHVIYYRVLFPALCVSLLQGYNAKGHLTARAGVMLLASLFTVLRQGGGAGIAAYLLMLALLLLYYRRSLPKWLSLSHFTALCAALFIGVVFFRIQYAFAFFIEGVMHRSLDFTRRVEVWEAAFKLVAQHPVTGYGVFPVSHMITLYLERAHAHNHMLELLVQGGVIGLLPFLGVIGLSGHRLVRYRAYPAAKILAITLFGLIAITMVEKMIYCTLFYPLFLLAWRADCLDGGKNTLSQQYLIPFLKSEQSPLRALKAQSTGAKTKAKGAAPGKKQTGGKHK